MIWFILGGVKNKRFMIRRGSIADKAIQTIKIATFVLVLIGMGIEL